MVNDFEVKPPIIVDQAGDVLLFKTMEDAERYLEPPEILEGTAKAYDSEGRLITLDAPGAARTNVLGMTVYTSGKVSSCWLSNGLGTKTNLEQFSLRCCKD